MSCKTTAMLACILSCASCVWTVVISLLPVVIAIQLVRLALADADLTLLYYAWRGWKPASLRGKVVWITGASSGIGEHLAYELARAGCRLILSARRVEELNRVKNNCLTHQSRLDENDFLVLPFDLLDTERHTDMVQKALKHFHGIDILVNNAARSQRAFIKDTPLSVDREMVDLLVLAQISLTKQVLPQFLQQKQGHVVVTSSLSGKIGTPYSATYSLGKFALHGFFEAMRVEHAADNIDVTMICPGPVHTNIRQHSFTDTPGEVYGFKHASTERRMTAERCAFLTTVAIVNKVGEAWLSPHPALFFAYMTQYAPNIARIVAKKFGLKAAGMARGAELKTGQGVR